MIKAYTPLNNLEYTVFKPIIASMVKSFSIKYLKDPDILVMYTINKDRFGEGMYDTDYANEFAKRWLEVDYKIEQDDSYVLTNNLRNNDGVVLLEDREIDYYIKSIPITHNFIVTIKIWDKFKNRLRRLLENFKMGEINDTNYLILNADVFFTIPGNVIKLTDNICNLKYGGKVDWFKYIERFSKLPLDKLNSKSGKRFTPVYRGEYRDIAVWTEVGFLDKEIEVDENGYSLELTLKFSFDVITSLEVIYPILVVNKPINKEYLLISETMLKRYALPIERSVYDSSLINTFVTYLGKKLRSDVSRLLEHMDLTPYVKLLEKSPELKNYGKDIKEIIKNSIDEWINDMYRLNYNIKRVFPIYDVWRGYKNYDGFDVSNVLLLQIKPKSYVYFNLYELLNIGYSKSFVDYLINNKDDFIRLYNSIFHFNIYANNELIPMNELDIITEDKTIDKLNLNLKKGDVVNKVAIEHNLANENKLYIDLLKYYHFVMYISNDPILIEKYNNEDLSLLLQYVSMNRLTNLGEFKEEEAMKTVMQFSILADNINSKSPLVNKIMKDLIKG